VALLVAAGAACANGSAASAGSAASVDPTTYAATVASSDLYVGAPQRVQVGIFNQTQSEGTQLVTSGSIQLMLKPTEGSASPTSGSASYVPAPGTGGQDSGTPSLTAPDVARGVYQLENVTFGAPG